MPARGWDAGPTDADGDQVERTLTQAVIDPYDFDTPEVDEILQAEYDETGCLVIPVRLVGSARINTMPTRLRRSFKRTLAASPAPAVKILAADPRRAVLTIHNPGPRDCALGRSQAEANDVDAFVIPSSFTGGIQGPFRFHFTDELWARCRGGTTNDLHFAVETWAR
jgi:hypothetical protein